MMSFVCYFLFFVPGASVRQLNTEGESPLTHAEYANQQEIVKLLRAALEQEGGELVENDGDFLWGACVLKIDVCLCC